MIKYAVLNTYFCSIYVKNGRMFMYYDLDSVCRMAIQLFRVHE